MMSPKMIVGGSSEEALFSGVTSTDQVDQEGGALLVGRGLGFFTRGIIDQHFDTKARLGRLIIATSMTEGSPEVGFGIDENTALVVDLKTGLATVVGSAQVILVEPSGSLDPNELPYTISSVQLASLGAGDQVDLDTLQVTPAPDKKPTVGKEYYAINHPTSNGILSSYGSLNQLLSVKLIDNKNASKATSYLIHPDEQKAYRLSFSKSKESRGYWAYRDGQEDHYTVTGIQLCIEPIQLSIKGEGQ
jgi:hypothetical protein